MYIYNTEYTKYLSAHLGIEPLIRIIVPVQSKHTTSGPALMVSSRLVAGNDGGVWVYRTAAESGHHFAGEQPNASRVHPHPMESLGGTDPLRNAHAGRVK